MSAVQMFGGVFANKRVLVTGHTGFKGSWLCSWLLKMGAQVTGFAIDIPTQPALFNVLQLPNDMTHHFGDVRDPEHLQTLIAQVQPDFVFHLAAQAIVSSSYRDPVNTITTNAIGTAQLLDALRQVQHPCVALFITSDKCYENVEWVYGYRETDALGGKDIYSGSKAAAEAVFHSFHHAFFKSGHPVRLASARAGNVIGGGDWAPDRIVADCIRAWSAGKVVEIRSPDATRPWQHVLEPLSGYLTLASALTQKADLHGESFNFGPRDGRHFRVLDLLETLAGIWGFANPKDAYRITGHIPFHEAGLLRLNCDKALFHLRWQATLEHDLCVKFTGDWYRAHHDGKTDMRELTHSQIAGYCEQARARQLAWAMS